MQLKVKPPSAAHVYGTGYDLIGNTFVVFRTRNHVDCIWGLYKGHECFGGILDMIEEWHKEGEQLVFTDHPRYGNFVLVMGIPVKEIIGPEADAIVAEEQKAAQPDATRR